MPAVNRRYKIEVVAINRAQQVRDPLSLNVGGLRADHGACFRAKQFGGRQYGAQRRGAGRSIGVPRADRVQRPKRVSIEAAMEIINRRPHNHIGSAIVRSAVSIEDDRSLPRERLYDPLLYGAHGWREGRK